MASKFDSTKALINKTGRALRARQSGFCRAFVESNFESIFCVNISKIISINARVTAVRLLSRAVISDNFTNSSENIMRNRNSTPQNSKNPHAKWAAKPPFLVPLFSSFGGWNSCFSSNFPRNLQNYRYLPLATIGNFLLPVC